MVMRVTEVPAGCVQKPKVVPSAGLTQYKCDVMLPTGRLFEDFPSLYSLYLVEKVNVSLFSYLGRQCFMKSQSRLQIHWMWMATTPPETESWL